MSNTSKSKRCWPSGPGKGRGTMSEEYRQRQALEVCEEVFANEQKQLAPRWYRPFFFCFSGSMDRILGRIFYLATTTKRAYRLFDAERKKWKDTIACVHCGGIHPISSTIGDSPRPDGDPICHVCVLSEERREMLERVEWNDYDTPNQTERCVCCGQAIRQNHAPDCELAKLIQSSTYNGGA